jgi:hypothetical protein
MTADISTPQEDDRAAKLWWAVPAATALLLIGLAVLIGKPPEMGRKGSSYDPSDPGFRAAYLLLDELGYPVERSKRPAGGAARWVLYPSAAQDRAVELDGWINRGGTVILADDKTEFARHLGLEVKVHQLEVELRDEPASGAGIARLAGGKVYVEGPKLSGVAWAKAGGRPMVTRYQRGRGEIWLVNRPEFLTNRLLKEADNAILFCRLADAALDRRSGKLSFDEYFHGMHEKPGVAELLFEPPTLWVTLEGLLLVGLLLWHYVPRFGTFRPETPTRRRSKEEFLDALAFLLERKGDYAEAYRTAREEFVRDVERDLGVPPGTGPEQLLLEAARRPIRPEKLRRVLGADALPPGAGKPAFVQALNELESTRDEYFHGRHNR